MRIDESDRATFCENTTRTFSVPRRSISGPTPPPHSTDPTWQIAGKYANRTGEFVACLWIVAGAKLGAPESR